VVELELLGVRVELPSNTPVMLLQELEGRRRKLSIFIGGPEAAAIAFALDGVDPPRPLTHDLACTLVSELGSSLERVVITELRDTTFYAELHLADPGAGGAAAEAGGAAGEEGEPAPPLVISARPSDAVALAVRVGAPIFATEELLGEAGYSESEDEETPEEVVEEFREFIQNVSPDDFAS
jgi:bifunctional DNase/RNase